MPHEAEPLISPKVEEKTRGFLMRAFEPAKNSLNGLDISPHDVEGEFDDLDQLKLHQKKNNQSFWYFMQGLCYLNDNIKDGKLRSTAGKVTGMMVGVETLHTFFGDVPEISDLAYCMTYVSPISNEGQFPRFVVVEPEGSKRRVIIIPEVWIQDTGSDDPNIRLEALAAVAYTASYMESYYDRNHIKADLSTAKARAEGRIPNPEEQEDFDREVEGMFVDIIEKRARRSAAMVLHQGATEIQGSNLSSEERKTLGVERAGYVPTGEPYRTIFYSA